MTPARRAHRTRGEGGSMLLLALVFVTVFAVLISAVITFTDVGLRSSRAFGTKGRTTYAADGAIQAAIHRYGSGGACDDFDAPLGPDGEPVGGRALTVHCSGASPGGDRANKPVNALLSLGPEGIETTKPLRTLGSVFSNSTVTAGATLVVQGRVEATGDCTGGPIQTEPPGEVRCATVNGVPVGGFDASRGRDPGYVKAATSVPPRRTVPACPVAPAWLVTLAPGYYDDAAALTALTGGSCANVVVWFQPGFYYFDFTFRGGAATWTVNDASVDVVAGAPKGWDPAAPARPALTLPGACRSDATGGPPEGVQMVMGGGTHLRVDRGRVELCARPDPADQSIALYGMAPEPAGDKHTLEPTAVPTVVGFTEPAAAVVIGETPVAPATAELGPGAASAAQLVFKGFRPGIPAGSLIDAVTLRVAHQDIGDMGTVTAKVEFPGATSGGCTPPALPLHPAAVVEDRVDLVAACNLTDPAAFADLAVTIDASLAPAGAAATEKLDGVALEVAYRTPTTRRPAATTVVSGFANPADALEIAEQPAPLTADAALTAGVTTTASLTVVGLGDPPLPAGSVIDSAKLRVAHRDAGDLAPPTVTASFAGGTCTDLPLALSPTAIADDRLDLKACGLDTAAELAGLSARYDVALAPSGVAATASLDGMWLELVYRPPALTHPPATVTPTVFTGADNAKVIGEQPTPLTADAALDTVTTTASLAFDGFDQGIPPGSFVESATLRVAHRDEGDTGAPALSVPFTASTCPTPGLTHRPAAIGEDTVDLRACGLTDTSLLGGLTVTYTAALDGGGTAATSRVDGVVLDLAYRPPSTRRAATATSTTFTDPDNAKVAGEQPTALTADAALGAGGSSASLTLGSFDQLAIPAGSVIDSAKLRVTHQEDATLGPATVHATFPGSTCTPTALPTQTGALGVHRVDVKACGFDDAADLAGLSVVYAAALAAGAPTARVPTTAGAVSGFTAADDARAVDGAAAMAELTSGGATSASVTLDGYDGPAPPAGSAVASAVLRIAHRDDGEAGPITAAVSFPGSTCATPATLPARANAITVDTVDLVAACGLTDPAQLAGVSVTYSVALAGGGTASTHLLDGAELDVAFTSPGTARVDGVELEVVFRPPTFRPLDGCHTVGPYPATATSCALVNVRSDLDAATRFAVAGTVYAPTAALDIAMANVTSQVFTRGLIARAIRLGIAAALSNKRPVTGIPPEAVVFTAYPKGNATGTATSSAFAPPGAAEEADGTEADAAIDTASPTFAELDIASFTTALPAGAAVDALVLRVRHREDQEIGAVKVSVSVPGCVDPQVTALPTHTAGLVEDQVVVKACGTSTAGQIAGLTVTYRVDVDLSFQPALPPIVHAYLDAITLDVLSGPVLRARVVFDRGTATVNGWTALP